MYTCFRKNEKLLAWVQVAILVFAALVPVLTAPRVEAAQVTSRSITMGSSEPGATTTYRIQFTVPDQSVQAFRVEFCDNNPIPNTTCSAAAVGDDIPNLDSAALNGTPAFDTSNISMDAPSAGDHYLDFETALPVTASDTTFDVTINDVVNPDNSTDGGDGFHNNPFYARIYVYSGGSTAPGDPALGGTSANTNQLHEGGVAMTTAEQITVTARVQETIDFCVGDTLGGNNCSTVSGSDIDLGVLSSTEINHAGEAPSSTNATDSEVAVLGLTTNAAEGVSISYLATPLTGNGTSTACGDEGVAVTTDECINEKQTQGALTAGTEAWGIAVNPTINNQGDLGGDQLSIAADYNAETNGGTYNDDTSDYHVEVSSSSIEIASSTGVVDREFINVNAGATPQITTPTGLYSSTLTFVATATF